MISFSVRLRHTVDKAVEVDGLSLLHLTSLVVFKAIHYVCYYVIIVTFSVLVTTECIRGGW